MRPPLHEMKIRDNSKSNTFGNVRNGGKRVHQGWDLEAPVGTPVYAIATGKVALTARGGDYGNQIMLKVEHNGRTLYPFYAHLSHIVVKNGQKVTEGQIIGHTGRTGNAVGHGITPHLHFEIRDRPNVGYGLPGRLDPATFFGTPPMKLKPTPVPKPPASNKPSNNSQNKSKIPDAGGLAALVGKQPTHSHTIIQLPHGYGNVTGRIIF